MTIHQLHKNAIPFVSYKQLRKELREKAKKELADSYIIMLIKRGSQLTETDITPEMIQIKRAAISINKHLQHLEKGIIKTCGKHGYLTLEDCIKSGKDLTGKQNYRCRQCLKKFHHANYLKNKEKIYKDSREWKKKNPERNRELARKSYTKCRKKNPFEKRKRDQRYREKNRKSINLREKIHRRKEIAELKDTYVKEIIIRKTGMKYNEIPLELIEITRAKLKLRRERIRQLHERRNDIN